MKTLLNIFFIITALVVLSSCAKDELETPDSNAIPNAMIIDNSGTTYQEPDSFIHTSGGENPQVLEVNDDGDDESAGSNPDAEKKK